MWDIPKALAKLGWQAKRKMRDVIELIKAEAEAQR